MKFAYSIGLVIPAVLLLFLVQCDARPGVDTECQPGETTKKDCNSCFCSNDGRWGCTRIGCGTVTTLRLEKRDVEEKQCTNLETKWEGNDYCVCNEGDWNCQDIGPPCKAGDTKTDECNNHCWCSEDGLWACTLMGCQKFTIKIRDKRETEANKCTELDSKWEGNDFCVCNAGDWSCQELGPPCKAGDNKTDECNNQCLCSEGGLWECTRRGCQKTTTEIRDKRETEANKCTELDSKWEGNDFCVCNDGDWSCQELGPPCKAGDTKTDECNNQCLCSEGGLWQCTRIGCQKTTTEIRDKREANKCTELDSKWEGNDYCVCNEGDWSCDELGPPCKAGDTKMADCNHCWCSESGLWACTLMGCQKFTIDIRDKREAESNKCTDLETKWEGNDFCTCNDGDWNCDELGPPCTPGETKKEDCNTCHCTTTGLWACTEIGCKDDIRLKREVDECINGTTKFDGNIFCKCSSNQWNCTEAGEPCPTDPTKWEVCNKMGNCTCIDIGLRSCHKKNCPHLNIERGPCMPGETKQEDCNHCFCTTNSFWVCTRHKCNNKFTKSKRTVVPVLTDLGNTPCAPDDYFKVDCNTCYCNLERTGYLCTQNMCSSPPDNETVSDNSTDSTLTESSTSDSTISAVDVADQTGRNPESGQTIIQIGNPTSSSESHQESATSESFDSSNIIAESSTTKVDDGNFEGSNRVIDQNQPSILRLPIPSLEDTNWNDTIGSSSTEPSTLQSSRRLEDTHR